VKQPKNFLHLPKPTRNTRKIANKLMTVASGKINLQSKHDLICHKAKVKAATSTHSMADVIPFFGIFIIPFESNASMKPKENIFYPQQREQEDLLDLITALLKFNCFLSTTVATQCIFQSNL